MEFCGISIERNDINAYNGTMKMILTMYLCRPRTYISYKTNKYFSQEPTSNKTQILICCSLHNVEEVFLMAELKALHMHKSYCDSIIKTINFCSDLGVLDLKNWIVLRFDFKFNLNLNELLNRVKLTTTINISLQYYSSNTQVIYHKLATTTVSIFMELFS